MPSKKPKPSELREAFKSDLAACWQYARSLHPKETPYAFALHGLEGTPHLYPCVLTEEGLTEVAKRYITQGYYETLAEARKELRYSIEDSPHHTELDEHFATVDALVEPVEDTLDETERYSLLAKAAMDAFAALDKQGLFGKGKQREKLLLMIDTSLAEKDWSSPSVKKLNPRAAAKRYENETKVEGDFNSASYLQLSADGRSLCYKSYREVDPRTGKVFDDLVVCDVVGNSLKRRWAISSRNTEIYPDISCAPDGTVFVRETKGDDDDCKTKITRYAKGEKSRQTQIVVSGEARLVFSPNGARTAMCVRDKLQLLDEKLQPQSSHRIPEGLRAEQFLRSGELLATGSRRLALMDAKGKWRNLPYQEPVRWFSLSADESLCAISIYKGGIHPKPKDQHGFKVLSFPKLKLVRNIQIPGHQLIRATLSSDGKLAACEASEIGTPKKFIAVFDVKTGREIARRKSDTNAETVFVPAKPVLAIGTGGHTKGEPVLLWKIPR